MLIAGPDNITPQSTFERFFQTRDDQTWVRGKHTVRYGGDVVYRKVQVTNYVSCAPQITALPNSMPVGHNGRTCSRLRFLVVTGS